MLGVIQEAWGSGHFPLRGLGKVGEAVRREVARQLRAGEANQGRFVMSLGSPVTPGTPVERVRRYCELVRELQG